MTPKIILIIEDGLIQQVIANQEVEIYNLDTDLFGADMDYPEFFEDRKIDADVYTNSEKFNQVLQECKSDWDSEMNAKFQDDDKPEKHYPVEDWMYQVANKDTTLGYDDWVEHCRERDADD